MGDANVGSLNFSTGIALSVFNAGLGRMQAMGIDPMPLWEALEAANRGGWAELWPDAPRDPSSTLGGLSAARLGLVLSSDDSRWLLEGELDPTAIDGALEIATETDCGPDEGAGRFSWAADPEAPRRSTPWPRCSRPGDDNAPRPWSSSPGSSSARWASDLPQ